MIARWGYLFGGLLLFAGLVISPLFCCGVFVAPIATLGDAEQFAVPGTHRFSTTEPGNWAVYTEVSGIFNGAKHEGDEELPDGMVITVTDLQTNQDIPALADEEFEYFLGDTYRIYIVDFDVPAAGWYEVSVTGFDEARVFTVEEEYEPSLSTIVTLLVLSLALGAGGVVMMIVTKILRGRPDEPREYWVSHVPPR